MQIMYFIIKYLGVPAFMVFSFFVLLSGVAAYDIRNIPSGIEILHSADNEVTVKWKDNNPHEFGYQFLLKNLSNNQIKTYNLPTDSSSFRFEIQKNNLYSFQILSNDFNSYKSQEHRFYYADLPEEDVIFECCDNKIGIPKEFFDLTTKIFLFSEYRKTDTPDIKIQLDNEVLSHQKPFPKFSIPIMLFHPKGEVINISKNIFIKRTGDTYENSLAYRTEELTAVIPPQLTNKEYSYIFPLLFDFDILNRIELVISNSAYKSIEGYAELFRSSVQENIRREGLSFIDANRTISQLSSSDKYKDCALIFVHGHQIETLDKSFNISSRSNPWINNDRIDVWRDFFKEIRASEDFKNTFDFYEFIYDTHALSAKQYGEMLAGYITQLKKSGNYKDIFIIAHSMGGLVSRYAMNTVVSGEAEYLGTYVTKVYTLDAVNRGSPLQSVVRSFDDRLLRQGLINYPMVYDYLAELVKSFPSMSMDFNYANLFYDDVFVQRVSFLLTQALKYYPNFFAVFVSQNLLGIFNGPLSFEYSDGEYLRKFQNYFYPGIEEVLFVPNTALNSLINDERFTEKYCEVISNIAYPLTDNKPIDPTHYSEYVHLGMRLFNDVLADVAAEINMPEHSLSDGMVTVWGQTVKNDERTKLRFIGLDHAQVYYNHEVITSILKDIAIRTLK